VFENTRIETSIKEKKLEKTKKEKKERPMKSSFPEKIKS
jgi:hypothetical protein